MDSIDDSEGGALGGDDALIDRFLLSSAEFERRLRAVRPEHWSWPTPCTEWNVRQLVNHVTRGNLNYVALLRGGSAADFLRRRDEDALGEDPLAAYRAAARECAQAFGQAGALQRTVDYPLGRVAGRQALAVRTTDNTVHTWDLARAVGGDETLDSDLVAWINDHLVQIYAGLSETPTAPDTTHRFFAAPVGTAPAQAASGQARLLHVMGRAVTASA
jgi:uncharacterized protein (TIGR03086 family)